MEIEWWFEPARLLVPLWAWIYRTCDRIGRAALILRPTEQFHAFFAPLSKQKRSAHDGCPNSELSVRNASQPSWTLGQGRTANGTGRNGGPGGSGGIADRNADGVSRWSQMADGQCGHRLFHGHAGPDQGSMVLEPFFAKTCRPRAGIWSYPDMITERRDLYIDLKTG
jgi:hypothetical protein